MSLGSCFFLGVWVGRFPQPDIKKTLLTCFEEEVEDDAEMKDVKDDAEKSPDWNAADWKSFG